MSFLSATAKQGFLFSLILAGLVFCPSLLAEEETATRVRLIEQTIYPGDAGLVMLDLSIGDLEIYGSDGRDVEVEVHLFCHRKDIDRCQARSQRIYLEPRMRQGKLDIALKRTPRNRAQGISARMRVRVPRHLPLEADVRGGDVEISGMESALEVDALNSDVEIHHQERLINTVKLDVGVGRGDLWVGQGHIEATGFPRSLTWRGQGQHRIEVDLGSGKIAVRLE